MIFSEHCVRMLLCGRKSCCSPGAPERRVTSGSRPVFQIFLLNIFFLFELKIAAWLHRLLGPVHSAAESYSMYCRRKSNPSCSGGLGLSFCANHRSKTPLSNMSLFLNAPERLSLFKKTAEHGIGDFCLIVKETESHVYFGIVLALLLLLLLLLFRAGSGGGGGDSDSTTGGNGRELGGTFSNELQENL